jgi:glycosyltransferase involved in cell wall biosynthesis
MPTIDIQRTGPGVIGSERQKVKFGATMVPQPGLVSVVVPCFNTARFVEEAVASALSQTYPHVEVVVVNDGSTDDFDRVIEPYRTSIRVIDQPNAGLAAARNRGVRESRGEFVAFLDADDAWKPAKLARQFEALRDDPNCVLVHTLSADVGASGEPLPPQQRPWSARLAQGNCTLPLLEHNTITVSSVLVRRDSLSDEPFLAGMPGCEDWRLWLELSLKGSFAYVDEPLTMYRIHGANMSKKQLMMQRSVVAVLSQFLTMDLPPAVLGAATRQAKIESLTLANIEYASGNFPAARTLFLEAAAFLRWADTVRLVLTLLPESLRTGIRALRGRSYSGEP